MTQQTQKHELTFLQVTFENFGIFKDKFTHAFNGMGITQVVGINEWFEPGNEESRSGSGKSYFCDLIYYALYGTTRREVTKDKIINKETKKNMYIGLELQVGKDKYLIERYRKHYKYKNNVFLKMWKEGDWLDISHAENVDKQIIDLVKIEQSLFEMSHLLAQDGTPIFFHLNSQGRLAIFEKLISGMGFDRKISLLKREQTKINKKLEEAKTNYVSKKSEVDTLKKTFMKSWSNHESKVSDYFYQKELLKKQIDSLGVSIEDIEEQKRFFVETIQYKKETDELTKKITETSNTMKTVKNTLKSTINMAKRHRNDSCLEDENCPHCNGTLKSKENVRTEAIKQFGLLVKESVIQLKHFRSLRKNLKELNEIKIDPVKPSSSSSRLSDEIKKQIVESIKTGVPIEIVSKLNELKLKLDKLTQPKRDYEFLRTSLKEIRDAIEETENRRVVYEDIKEIAEINSFWSTSYQTKMRQFAISKIIPHFNKIFSDILKIVYKGHLDIILNGETLSEAIVYCGEEYEYEEFSTGEKKRINICFYLAMLLLIRINIITSNVLHLDEIFSSTDPLAIRLILDIIQDNFPDVHIYLVSHENKIEQILEDNPKIVIRKTAEFSAQVEQIA